MCLWLRVVVSLVPMQKKTSFNPIKPIVRRCGTYLDYLYSPYVWNSTVNNSIRYIFWYECVCMSPIFDWDFIIWIMNNNFIEISKIHMAKIPDSRCHNPQLSKMWIRLNIEIMRYQFQSLNQSKMVGIRSKQRALDSYLCFDGNCCGGSIIIIYYLNVPIVKTAFMLMHSIANTLKID